MAFGTLASPLAVRSKATAAQTSAQQASAKPRPTIPSADFPYQSQFVQVLGSRMHYVEAGAGDPVLLLHGIPTGVRPWRWADRVF